jgi:hypothetical protein
LVKQFLLNPYLRSSDVLMFKPTIKEEETPNGIEETNTTCPLVLSDENVAN